MAENDEITPSNIEIVADGHHVTITIFPWWTQDMIDDFIRHIKATMEDEAFRKFFTRKE